MNRIGTTTSGGAIVEISRAELATLQAAGELLSEIAACVLIDQPAPVIAQKATQIARKQVKVSVLPASGTKVCTRCGKTKAASEFYNGHGKCKPCFAEATKERKGSGAGGLNEKQKAARKAQGLAVVDRVAAKVKAGGTFMARERDPVLDPPTSGGRTLRVGGES